MLRVQTSFQDTPGDGYYFVLLLEGKPLCEQLNELGLKNGDRVILYDEECDDLEIEATLLVDHKHPMMFERALWAKQCEPEVPSPLGAWHYGKMAEHSA